VGHISLVFREMWDSAALSLPPSSFNRLCRAEGQDTWYPISRKNERDMGHPASADSWNRQSRLFVSQRLDGIFARSLESWVACAHQCPA